MSDFFDKRETRSADERAADMAERLPKIIAYAKEKSAAYAESLSDVDAATVTDMAALSNLPVTRKDRLSEAQKAAPPLGGFNVAKPPQLFQSPGPIYEMGGVSHDWWRFGRFLHAAGVGPGDIVQNTFAYHFTPAGMMFENGAHAVGATVFPAGPGQTELQAQAAHDLGVTTYAGTPDYLATILAKGEELGLDLSRIKRAVVSGGPLFPQVRAAYQDRGMTCLQCYATADLGHIAYESPAMEGMICDEDVLVEIVRPGTGDPVAEGEIGEVLVTTFNEDYPLIRFSTGDMSSVLPGISPCGRTNMRITGWRGRADQATKVKGMFIRPEQVARLVDRHDEIKKARIKVTHDGSNDVMTVMIEAASKVDVSDTMREVLKLRGEVEIVEIGSLPSDGIVIEDLRKT